MAITITQGDSYLIPIALTQDGHALTPDMIDDLEIMIGKSITRRMSDGGIAFDPDTGYWYITPTQSETLVTCPGYHGVCVRVKYKNQPPSTKVDLIDRVFIKGGPFKEVI